ncbi:unnamed protein product [Cylindrotheca closterium]|uniref:Uncharacterized protein n=1 Tax=Cylindrotheca closterium TaxID=2856 RepID=A0AAD2G5Z8_9STRA|nr:unnamed protein product [Cylindrotheca closterium]
MMPGEGETSSSSRSSIGSIPLSISGSFHSLLSAVTIDDESSAGEGSLDNFSPLAMNRDWRFGSKPNLTSMKSRDSLGKFAANNLKERTTPSRMPSTMGLPMPTRKASSNQIMGLNMPTRKASLYNMKSKDNLRNATFENLNSSPALSNAKFDLITGVEPSSAESKKSLFPQVRKQAPGVKLYSTRTTGTSPSSTSTCNPAFGLPNDIFVVHSSPGTTVSKPSISPETMNGFRSIFRHCREKSIDHGVPSVPERKKSSCQL